MKKEPFYISATKQGAGALIRITGEIGFETSAEGFRSQVDELIKDGIKDVHIYINSPGGSCFDAAEIVNILSNFSGRVTGAGGALVASAATFIALHCESFTMPGNGMFMIHKPAGGVHGTAAKIESYLKLLKDIEAQYYNKYANRVTNKTDFETHWIASDWWLTAAEAKEVGLITSVEGSVPIDQQTAAIITACGCPVSKLPTINNNINDMDFKAMAKSLGLPESATDGEIQAAIEAGRKAQTDLQTLREETTRKEKEALTAKIKTDVQKAVTDKRITADVAPKWETALAENYEHNIELLNALSPVKKIPFKPSTNTPAGSFTYQGKTFEALQEENPDALAALQKDDPAAYDELFTDYLNRNKLK